MVFAASRRRRKNPARERLNGTVTRLEKLRRRWRAESRKGSAAIEFAMIMPVFFVLLMGIFEAGMLFFAQFTLQNAVQDAGRMVRTGQAQTAGMTQAQFKTVICNEISALMSCSKLQVDVENFSGYSAVNYQNPLKSDGTLNTALNNYNIGTACNVVLVRGFYTWPVWGPGLVWFLTNMTDGSGNKAHLLAAAAAFRNEPFNSGAAGC